MSTGEDIQGRVTELGPSVERDVAFGNDNDSADALRTKVVKMRAYHCSTRLFGGGYKLQFNGRRIVEVFRWATIELG